MSEGRIEPKTGNLMCSYHGWQFNGQGQCTAIPQAESADIEKKMCANSGSCVKKFPVKVSSTLYLEALSHLTFLLEIDLIDCLALHVEWTC